MSVDLPEPLFPMIATASRGMTRDAFERIEATLACRRTFSPHGTSVLGLACLSTFWWRVLLFWD
jgi:hypothetical protein